MFASDLNSKKNAPVPEFGIFDLDSTLFMHWDGLGPQIDQVVYDIVIQKLVKRGFEVSQADLEAMIYDSYRSLGQPTLKPAQVYGLDHEELHREYHGEVFTRLISPQFNERAAPDSQFYTNLRLKLKEAQEAGMKLNVLTHGDNRWAESLTDMLGIGQYFDVRKGIDGYGGRMKHVEKSLYTDFLAEAGYKGPIQNVFMVEDSPRNLVIPAEMGIMPIFVGASKESVLGQIPPQTRKFANTVDALEMLNILKREHNKLKPVSI